MGEKIVLFYGGDAAGKNITSALRTRGIEAAETQESALYLQDIRASADVCVVASKHRSESGTPVLTTHPPGNFRDAAYGGKPKELGIAPALYLHEALLLLTDEKPPGYEVCLEATHHGPTSLPYPVMFVEVGSGERQWNDASAYEAAAEAISRLLAAEPKDLPTAVGFGGGHYCRKFSEVTEYALGHICPKHSLSLLDEKMITQMAEKTTPRPKVALVEKKGLGTEKENVMRLLEDAFLEVVRI